MQISLNQEKIEISTDTTTLYDVLQRNALPLSRIAVRVNKIVVHKTLWQSKIIHENDNIETITLVSGG